MIEFKNVAFSYYGQRGEGLRNLSLTVLFTWNRGKLRAFTDRKNSPASPPG
ncbi:hypothetical protein [Lacrimispora brassicae]